MKKIPLIIILVFSGISMDAQWSDSLNVRKILTGHVVDEFNKKDVAYAHIINQHTSQGIIADSAGLFQIPARSGDTIFVSALGYHFDIYPLGEEDVDSIFDVKLILRAYTLQEVVIHELDTYDKFRKGFMDARVESDEYHVPGLPHIQPREVPLLRDTNYIRKAGFALRSPISFLYLNLSKREKNKRLYYQLVENDRLRAVAEQRYNDTIIARITGLSLEELGLFKDYCNFQPNVILQMSDYEYYTMIRRKQYEYKEFRKKQLKKINEQNE